MDASVTAVMLLGGQFERDGRIAVAALFATILATLTGAADLH